MCEPYGFGSVFELNNSELFNCSYDQLVQQLSNYSNSTVYLDRSPGSAFYSIIQVCCGWSSLVRSLFLVWTRRADGQWW